MASMASTCRSGSVVPERVSEGNFRMPNCGVALYELGLASELERSGELASRLVMCLNVEPETAASSICVEVTAFEERRRAVTDEV